MLSEEKRDILFSIKLPDIDSENKDFEVCNVKLDYLNVIEMNNESKEINCSIKRIKTLSDNFSISIELDKQRNRINSTDALDKARKLADEGNLDEAKTVLVQCIDLIKKSASKDLEFCQSLIDDLNSCKDSLKSKEEYSSFGNKIMNNMMQTNSIQRSVNSTTLKSSSANDTKSKSEMDTKSKSEVDTKSKSEVDTKTNEEKK